MKSIPKMQNRKQKAALETMRRNNIANVMAFRKKAEELFPYCSTLDAFHRPVSGTEQPHIVFLSVGSPNDKAKVWIGQGETAEAAWLDAAAQTIQYLKNSRFSVSYLKADFVAETEKTSLEQVNEALKKTRQSFWRKGISMDEAFSRAFLEEELSANRLLDYEKDGISLFRINEYLQDNKKEQIFFLPDEVIVFRCQSVFCDEYNQCHFLYDNGYNYGRRKIGMVTKETVSSVVHTGGEKLLEMAGADGVFAYGYRAAGDKKILAYNILRHISSTWAMLMEYEREPASDMKDGIDRLLQYAITAAVEEINGHTFVIDHESNEIKLGACALLAVTLIEYMRIMQTTKYLSLVKNLGDGILQCVDEDEGGFWHILSYPEGKREEKSRIVYYDGEATFGLCMLYGLTKDRRYLDAAKTAMDFFIEKDYTKYTDHWIAYSLRELTKYCSEEKYLAFAIKNVTVNLGRIYERDTSFHTFLEMLMASFAVYDKIKKEHPQLPALQGLDEKWFITTIYYRAQHQLNGYMLPEYAMYFNNPARYLYSFVIRHDFFRMRIDDIEHFLGGYFHMWQDFDKLEEYREALGIAPSDYMTLQEKYLPNKKTAPAPATKPEEEETVVMEATEIMVETLEYMGRLSEEGQRAVLVFAKALVAENEK